MEHPAPEHAPDSRLAKYIKYTATSMGVLSNAEALWPSDVIKRKPSG